MNQSTVLAEGHVTPAAKIKVSLTDDMVTITWPARPTRVSPRRFPEIAARAMRIIANGSTELARLKAGTRP
jgi:hypothetical protein